MWCCRTGRDRTRRSWCRRRGWRGRRGSSWHCAEKLSRRVARLTYRLEDRSVSMLLRPLLTITFATAGLLGAQEAAPAPAEFTVATGTKVPLSLINSVSTKHSAEGDRVYL